MYLVSTSLCLELGVLCICAKPPVDGGSIAFAFAFSATSSCPSAAATVTIATRWYPPVYPPHLRHFSGSSRDSRHAKMSIQRLAPSHPPVISADLLQIVQLLS
jgi:hypothetical protein